MKKLVKNTTIYTLGNVLTKAGSFLLLPIYTRYLSPDQYGIVGAMLTLEAFLVIILSMSLERSILRLYWDYKTEKEKKDFLGTITLSIALVSLIMLLLIFVAHDYVGKIYRSINFYPFYAYAILYGFFSIFSYVPKTYLILKERAGYYALISIVQFLLLTGLILWFVVVKHESAVGMLKGRLISSIAMLPLFMFMSVKVINLKIDYDILKKAISFSWPLIPTIMMAWVLNLSDRIFIERFISLEEVGIYSLSYQIANLMPLLLSGLKLAYVPLFFRLANSDNQYISKQKIYGYNQVYLLVVILSGFVIALFANEVTTIFLHSRYHESILVIPLIIFSHIFAHASGILGLYFQQSKKMKPNLYIASVAAVVNIILNFLLVPFLGMYGAAYATILSLAICVMIQYLYCKRRCFYIPFSWKHIIPFSASCVLIITLSVYVLEVNLFTSLIIKAIIMIILGGILMRFYYKPLKAILVA